MKNAVKTLLVFASIEAVQSAPSPTRGTNTGFPKLSATKTFSNLPTSSETERDSDEIMDAADKNTGGTGTHGGLYRLFRFDDVVVYPTQALTTRTDADASNPPTLSNLADGQKTFYQTDLTKIGTWAVKTLNDATGGSSSLLDTSMIGKQKSGSLYGACSKDKISTTPGTNVFCSGMQSVMNGDNSGTHKEITGIKSRIFFSNEWTATTAQNVGSPAPQTTVVATSKPVLPHADFILGSFFQSNGDAANATQWCVSTGTGSADFLSEVASASGTTVTLKATTGIGPATKCTWQVRAHANTHGPMFEVATMVNTFATMQVVEWYDQTTLTSTSLIAAASANTAYSNSATGNSPIAFSATQYATSNGVFFNPLVDKADITATITSSTFSTVENTAMSQVNAADNVAGSAGMAIYWDRSGFGAQRGSVSGWMDSSMITSFFTAYNAVKTNFETEKTAYDTAKTEYETKFTDNAKDGKTVVPTRPDMPTTVPAYSGPSTLLSNQITTGSITPWTTGTGNVKDELSGTKFVLATGYTKYTATAPESYDYDVTKISANRVSYYQAAPTHPTALAATAGLGQVSATFGRLGQAASMNNANTVMAPFYWGAPGTQPADADTEKPGMMISVFPEFDSTRADWSDNANTDMVVINVVTKAWQSLSDYDTPTAPTAATAISVGAQSLAAAMLATATISATLF